MKKNINAIKKAQKRYFVLFFVIMILLSGCSGVSIEVDNNAKTKSVISDEIFEGYRLIEVDGGDLSGERESNVVVDIGFGDREYYAFTNEYGQLVKVIADEIVLQDDKKEAVLSTGRYFKDEAKVPGVESKVLDEGHVIADSLGGVSNAYNITPQDSTLNRHGDQAYMESVIRDAKGCKNFTAVITYPDTNTQIPSKYSFSYEINGELIKDEFPNKSPEKDDKTIEENKEENDLGKEVQIIDLDKINELITIKNCSERDINLEGWTIISKRGNQSFVFPEYILEKEKMVLVGDQERNEYVDFHWLEDRGVWNNKEDDFAELYDKKNNLVDIYED